MPLIPWPEQPVYPKRDQLRIVPSAMPHHMKIYLNGRDISRYVTCAEMLVVASETPSITLDIDKGIQITDELEIQVVVVHENNGRHGI